MDIKLTMFPDYINWVEGYADNVHFQAKLYDEPSVCGINGERVSKLFMDCGVAYDRGWDYGENHSYVAPVIDFLETTPKRFENYQGRMSMTEAYSRYKRERGE